MNLFNFSFHGTQNEMHIHIALFNTVKGYSN